MRKAVKILMLLLAISLASLQVVAQSTTGTISGTITDEKEGLLPSATVTARNTETNVSRTAQTDSQGRYRFVNLPIGAYEITVEATGFAKYVQTGIKLLLNQEAIVDVAMKAGGIQEVVNVVENASLLNTATAEVGTRFDARRMSELPLGTTRDIYTVALSAPGVSQLGSGQSDFAAGVNYSANGGRTRSNNFMIDGQDSNDPSISGRQQPLNNPDIVQEVRLITNQFLAEYGRNSGSVLNVVTKSGTNEFHGSGFWFHNDNALNACSNTDKSAGFCSEPGTRGFVSEKAPFRVENQLGGTLGGPIWKDHTFFFGSIQRWWDRRLGSGATLSGAPTEAGRRVLQSAVGSRPQVAALLRFLPAAQTPIGRSANFMVGGQTFSVPLGSLTGSSSIIFNNWQWSARIDHRISDKHTLNGRYLYNDSDSAGSGQVTPSGLTTLAPARQQAMNLSLTSLLSNRLVNDLRLSYQRLGSQSNTQDPSSEEIPSIEITELGLAGFNANAARTAIGLAVNLPQFRFNNTYQVQDNISYTVGGHAMKFGFDVRRVQVKSFFVPTIRGRLQYSSLQEYVDDLAQLATINKPLPGGQSIFYYDWHDVFLFWQDEWKVRPNFTLTYGLRYETPGNSFESLVPPNQGIVAAARGDQRFVYTPPGRDVNNFQPRLGFNWNPRTSSDGILGFITGGDKLVIRGGYARTHDYTFINITLNVTSAFPFLASITLPTIRQTPSDPLRVPNAFTRLPVATITGDPNQLTRTIVGDDFRSPYADQFSFEMQRELSRDVVLRVGYVGTKGTALFQTVDGNPRRPYSAPTPTDNGRVDPRFGPIRLRANSSSSIYHSLQTSVEKRLSRGFSAGVHYTWSSFIDDATDLFNPNPQSDIAVSQDSFDRRSDRARSSYDRPHRFTGNFVYELPYFRDQEGFIGRLLGGWQVNSFFTFQSGAPFTVLNGTDPTGALSGIDSLVGNAIRPNLNTNLNLSSMTVEEIIAAGGPRLFTRLTSPTGPRVGNAGRNILRADGIGNVDFGIFKNTRLGENQTLQIRAEFYNATNTRNFGIPNGFVNSSSFLNQWNTDGGNRRVVVGLRYTF